MAHIPQRIHMSRFHRDFCEEDNSLFTTRLFTLASMLRWRRCEFFLSLFFRVSELEARRWVGPWSCDGDDGGGGP